MVTDTSSEAAERVLHGLAQRREACVAQVVAEASVLGDYARLAPGETADLADTVREGLDAILHAIGEQRPLDDDDVAFLWPHISRRARAGVPEGDMLAVVRIFQRVLWDAIVELAGDDEDGRAAAVILARPLLDYIEVLSDTVNKAFLEASEAFESPVSGTRRALMEQLLAGEPPAPGEPLNAARGAGLDTDTHVVAIVARPQAGAAGDDAPLRVAASILARSAGTALEPLAVAREDELVVILPAREQDAGRVADVVRGGHERLAAHGLAFAVGASTIHQGLDEIPAAYAEACLALEQVHASAGVLPLSALDLLDYLILRAGDRTAWRLVPASVREFLDDDAHQGGVLSATLLAYSGCDLSVKLAARQLFVHPNTVHYRLGKIEARTGCDVRKLRDVQQLLTAITLRRVVDRVR
jgi:sugar diacid utilization regulator